jgi:ubiquinone/menaquinone biosynthesis C-methylase UbiE
MKPQTADNLRTAYDQWHRDRAAGEDSEATLNAPWNTFVRNFIGGVQDKKILEIACGRGQLSAFLAAQGARVTAADFSFGALEVIKRREGEGSFTAMNADATQIGVKDKAFDIVISCETIEHVTEPLKALREFHRILKKGGKLFLTFPSYLNTYGLYRLYLNAAGKPYNSGTAIQPRENWLFSWQILSELKKSGFQIRYSGGSGFYWLWPGKMPKNLYSYDPQRFLNRMLKPFALHAYVVAEK